MIPLLGIEPFDPPNLQQLPLARALGVARREILALQCGGEHRNPAFLALLDEGPFSNTEHEIQYYEQLVLYGRIARSPTQSYRTELYGIYKALHGKLTARYHPHYWNAWVVTPDLDIEDVHGYTCEQLPSYLWFMGEDHRLVFKAKPDWSLQRDELVRRLSPERRAVLIERSLELARQEVLGLEQQLRDLRPPQVSSVAVDALTLFQHVKDS